MKIEPLSGALGAEVSGIDLREAQETSVIEALRAAFHDRLLLVVRGQEQLAPEDQVQFCEFFGPLGARSRPAEDRHEGADAPAEVMFVSNRKERGRFIGSLPEGEMQFHIDQCYVEVPARATCLYAIAVPREGGDTIFCNLCAAYESLPRDLKAVVDGHRALNVFSYDATSAEKVDASARKRQWVQPMAVAHPETGRTALYVNPLMTWRIEGMDEAVGRTVLDRLFAHERREEFHYVHKWHPGDVVLWDNICTMHARTDFDANEDRHLRRFTVAGKPLRAA